MARVEWMWITAIERGSRVRLATTFVENDVFSLSTASGEILVTFKEDFDEIQKAESRVTKFLNSWQTHVIFQVGIERRSLIVRSARRSDDQIEGPSIYIRVHVIGEQALANH